MPSAWVLIVQVISRVATRPAAFCMTAWIWPTRKSLLAGCRKIRVPAPPNSVTTSFSTRYPSISGPPATVRFKDPPSASTGSFAHVPFTVATPPIEPSSTSHPAVGVEGQLAFSWTATTSPAGTATSGASFASVTAPFFSDFVPTAPVSRSAVLT